MYKIRAMVDSDREFIFSSWAKSFWDAPAVRGMTRDDYFDMMREVVAKKLELGWTWVACDEDDEDVVLGWANYDIDCKTLNYVYVRKKPFRGIGIAKNLVACAYDATKLKYSSKTTKIDQSRLPPHWRYTPAWLFR